MSTNQNNNSTTLDAAIEAHFHHVYKHIYGDILRALDMAADSPGGQAGFIAWVMEQRPTEFELLAFCKAYSSTLAAADASVFGVAPAHDPTEVPA